jgi:hypothetical protein
MHGATVLIHDAVLGRTPLHAAGKDIPNITQIYVYHNIVGSRIYTGFELV